MKKLPKFRLLLNSLLLLGLLAFFLSSLGCKAPPAEVKETAIAAEEEPAAEASLDEELNELDELDELEQTMSELEGDINLEELEGLELE